MGIEGQDPRVWPTDRELAEVLFTANGTRKQDVSGFCYEPTPFRLGQVNEAASF